MPKTARVEPLREKLLRDSEDPNRMKSITDKADPKRGIPKTESVEPNRHMAPTDNVLPNVACSLQHTVEARRARPRTDIPKPNFT
jgi:hypothetical protein